MKTITTEDLVEAVKGEMEGLVILKGEAEERYAEAEILDCEEQLNALTSQLYLRVMGMSAPEKSALLPLIEELISLFQKVQAVISRDSEIKLKIDYRIHELQNRKEEVVTLSAQSAP